ncbi:MAG: DUF4292 domain-containing protein [Sphingobacteriales bacterium]|nr:MAG: DUF4292 domain-containing protein [Sphingobacteriales bacterium]
MTKHFAAALLVVFAMSMTACKIGKKPTRKAVTIEKKADSAVVTVPVADPSKPALTLEKQALIDNLLPVWNKQIDFATFSGKSKMRYEGKGQKLDFTAHIRIQKDRVIWISVTAFLLQVARAYITPDSIMVVNYMEREASRMPISQVSKLLPAPVDFYSLQNLIVGNALKTSGTIATDATDFGGTWSLQMEAPNMIQQATYNKADTTMRSLQVRTSSGTTDGMIQYGNYAMIQGRKFADSRAINLVNNGERYYVDMNFNDVEFDKQLEFPFSIPKNYKIK